jgi:transcriptional regulator with GAF, ATPase, and Fis domain
MRRMYALLERYAASTGTVLIHGETGTGKELVAEAIHDASARRGKPFVVVDCSALSHELAESELFGHEKGAFTGAEAARAGAFEAADGGTIFLDEVGELSLELQPKLLRALESKTTRRVGASAYAPVDVRVIAATHRDLRVAINDKRFRADLYYRVNVLRVEVPPLREREDDVRLLATHLWSRLRPDREPPPALLDQLARQDWPGNVRELRNAVERAALVGWTPDPAKVAVSYQDAKAAWEAAWVAALLRAHGDNLTHAARAAQMGRRNLRELARRHGLRDAAAVDDE